MLESFWKIILRRRKNSLLALPALLLWLASFAYRLFFGLWKNLTPTGEKLSVPVICIGNITIGGTGKTPMVVFLARFLMDEGYRVAVASSGYGRRTRKPYFMQGYKMQELLAHQVGDEVALMTEQLHDAYFSVHEIKAEAARVAAESRLVDLVIVDDGFQHFRLHRDIDIVTFDAGIKERLLRPFPYGVMREPISALKRADIIVITRSKFAKDLFNLQKKVRAINENAQHYHAQFSSNKLIGRDRALPVKYLEDKSVFLFAGIGNFRVLRKQVHAMAADLDHALELNDHQVYDTQLLNRIKKSADKYDSDVIVTTAKDWVKIENFDFGREFYYLNQKIDLDPGEEKLIKYLEGRLNLKKQAV